MFANNNNQYGGNQYSGNQQQAPSLDSLDSLLTGSGAKSYFNADSQPGATVTGVIDLIEVTQVRDYQTQQPAYWNDGKPKEQIHIVLQTQLRDPSVEDDDGRRSLWIKGWGVQLKAFREACRKAGVKSPSVGDTMSARFTGLGERGNAPQPPKLYEYAIQHASQVDQLMGQDQAAQPQQATASQPQTQQTAFQQTQPQATPMQVRQLHAAGRSVQDISAMTGLSENQVAQTLQPVAGSEDEPQF
jgi:hypothetical protein